MVGGALGAVIELGVVRRLFNAPRLILLVAAIVVSQLILVPGVRAAGRDEQGGEVPDADSPQLRRRRCPPRRRAHPAGGRRAGGDTGAGVLHQPHPDGGHPRLR